MGASATVVELQIGMSVRKIPMRLGRIAVAALIGSSTALFGMANSAQASGIDECRITWSNLNGTITADRTGSSYGAIGKCVSSTLYYKVKVNCWNYNSLSSHYVTGYRTNGPHVAITDCKANGDELALNASFVFG